MIGLGDRICEALKWNLLGRTEWDEAPELYFMYNEDDGHVRSSGLSGGRGGWPDGPPAQALAAMAARLTCLDPGMLRAIAPGNFIGAAFFSEMWTLETIVGTPEMHEGRAAAQERRIHAHPDRIEQRVLWAVTLGRAHYTAHQNRGSEDKIEAGKVIRQEGAIPGALERIVLQFTSGSN